MNTKLIFIGMIILVILISGCVKNQESSEINNQNKDELIKLENIIPKSMKGYELYSFPVQSEEEWYFTLITGTNRLKTFPEITSDENK
ncbi:MAG: hypothetical protein QQN41_09055, partial [Nitrosopumilus sp.]